VAEFFPADKLFLIAGPCVLENDELNLRVGETLARLAEKIPGGIIYKASFDKANRSNRNAARGPGLDAGLEALARVRKATGLPVLTDVHTPDQCAPAASVVDVLQIPAFLCRQTDLLEAAGATGKPVNVKKGQWLQPEGMRGAVQKIRGDAKTNNRSRDIAVTERGTFFGYGDLVVDMRSFTLDLEISVMVRGDAFIDGLRGLEDSYREHSRELTLDEWLARPLHRRILDHVARLTAALR